MYLESVTLFSIILKAHKQSFGGDNVAEVPCSPYHVKQAMAFIKQTDIISRAYVISYVTECPKSQVFHFLNYPYANSDLDMNFIEISSKLRES